MHACIGEEGVRLKRFVAAQMVKSGLTKCKIIEYLEVLEENGNIEIKEDADLIREIK